MNTTRTLIDRARRLTRTASHARDADRLDEQLGRLAKAKDRLAGVVTRLRSVNEFLDLATHEGFGQPADIERQRTQAIRQLQTTLTAVDQDGVDTSPDTAEEARAALNSLVEALEHHARALWAARRAQLVPQGHAELLATLTRVPTFAPRARSCLDQYRLLDKQAPVGLVTVDDYQRTMRLAAQYRELWDALPLATATAELSEFFRRAVTGGASLPLLTPGVRTWLAEHGITDQFRILPGRPGH